MPSRNEVREYMADQYYHVYNRGVEKRIIFLDDQDYKVFLSLLKRYLAHTSSREMRQSNQNRHRVKPLNREVKLLAYCLMPNHFHLLLYQITDRGITKLMQRVITGYVMYFNHRYKRVGALFQRRYKASMINADDYLHHISRYVHLNPDDYLNWPYSSVGYYFGTKKASWLKTEPVLSLFNNDTGKYRKFLLDYKEAKKQLDLIKWQLADAP